MHSQAEHEQHTYNYDESLMTPFAKAVVQQETKKLSKQRRAHW
jgi:hypothetical protein